MGGVAAKERHDVSVVTNCPLQKVRFKFLWLVLVKESAETLNLSPGPAAWCVTVRGFGLSFTVHWKTALLDDTRKWLAQSGCQKVSFLCFISWSHEDEFISCQLHLETCVGCVYSLGSLDSLNFTLNTCFPDWGNWLGFSSSLPHSHSFVKSNFRLLWSEADDNVLWYFSYVEGKVSVPFHWWAGDGHEMWGHWIPCTVPGYHLCARCLNPGL